MFCFLLRGIFSNNNNDYNCITVTVFIHLEQKNKLTPHENKSKNHDYCYREMPEKDNNILKQNH